MKALLVHGDPDVRGTLDHALRDLGWEVTTMADADAARAWLESEPCRLLVAGPVAEGAELCRRVRSSPAAAVTCVILAVPGDAGSIEEAVLAGADDYLTLPLAPAEVSARLRLATRHAATAPVPPEVELLREKIGALQSTLGAQKALLEELFESTPLAVAVLDARGRVTRVNAEFTRTFGYTRAEVIGRMLDDLIVPEGEYARAFAASLGVLEGERIDLEGIRRRRDGTRLCAAILGVPVRIPGGQTGTYVVYRDITAQKEAEQKLRAQWELFHALAEHAPDIITRFDAKGRAVYISPAFERHTGIAARELLGRKPLDAPTSRAAAEALDTALRRAFETSEPQVMHFWGELRGERRYYEVRLVPEIDEAGTVVGGVSIARDVTERELVRERLEVHAAELEKEVEARSRFYATMSHELRTPISAIMLYTELLLADTLGPLGAEQREGVQRVQDGARRLYDLVHDLLDLARIEARKVPVQPTEVSVPDEVETALDSMRAVAASRGSELSAEFTPATAASCHIVTDPRRLNQILVNLLSNAIKFGRGRPIRIRCSPASEAPGGVALEVIDEGIGISRDDLEHIFEDFVQVGTHREIGSGLGLALSRRLAELLGGTLEASSVPDEGSTFRLVLPAVTPSTATSPAATAD